MPHPTPTPHTTTTTTTTAEASPTHTPAPPRVVPPQELWCKKGPPTAELISTYKAQPLPALTPPPPPPMPQLEKLRPLTALADQLGLLLQNHHQVTTYLTTY